MSQHDTPPTAALTSAQRAALILLDASDYLKHRDPRKGSKALYPSAIVLGNTDDWDARGILSEALQRVALEVRRD